MRATGWLAIVCILIIILAFVPIIDGFIFKRNLVNLIDVINRESKVNIKLLDYRMGWLTSTAKFEIRPKQMGAYVEKASDPKLIINSRIAHGPLIKNTLTNHYAIATAGVDSQIQVENAPMLGTIPILNIFSTTHSFGNVWHNKFDRPGVNYSAGGGTLVWDGVKGDVNFEIDDGLIKDFSSEFIFGKLMIDLRALGKPVESISFDPVTYSYQANQESEGLWVGEADLLAPELMVNFTDGRQILVQNLNFKSGITMPSTDLFNLKVDLNIDKLQIPMDFPAIQPLQKSIIFNRFSLNGLKNLKARIQELNESGDGRTELSEQEMNELKQIIASLVTKESNIEAQFLAKTDIGDITQNLTISLPKNMTVPMTADEIIAKAQGKMQLRASIPLVNKLISFYVANVPLKQQQPMQNVPPVKDIFTDNVAALLQQGKIDLPTSMKLIGLHNRNLNPAMFNNAIDTMSLSPDVSTQLKSEYSAVYTMRAQRSAQAATQERLASPEVQRQEKMGKINQTMTTWIQQGYLIQDQNHYVVTIIRENGTFLVNGKPMIPNAPQNTTNAPPAPIAAPPTQRQPNVPPVTPKPVSPPAIPTPQQPPMRNN